MPCVGVEVSASARVRQKRLFSPVDSEWRVGENPPLSLTHQAHDTGIVIPQRLPLDLGKLGLEMFVLFLLYSRRRRAVHIQAFRTRAAGRQAGRAK